MVSPVPGGILPSFVSSFDLPSTTMSRTRHGRVSRMLLPAVFTALAFANWAAASVIPIRPSISNSGVSVVQVDEVDVDIVEDIEVIVERRIDIIVGGTTGSSTISTLYVDRHLSDRS